MPPISALKAISCMDLTTLSGDDTTGRKLLRHATHVKNIWILYGE